MDRRNFDDFTRALATKTNRRGMIRGGLALVSGAIGLRPGGETEAATKPRRTGQVCRSNGDCSSRLCSEPDRTGRGRCLCGSTADCPKSNTICQVTTCSAEGVCGFVANAGAVCDTGNPCTTDDACDARGRCVGTPVVCAASDQCHDAGICDKLSGTCTNPSKPDNTTCNDGNRCTNNDVCIAGVCTGSPVVCPPPRACITTGICNLATGGCEYSFEPNDAVCDDGDACTTNGTCQNGSCVSTPVTCELCHFCSGGTCTTGFSAVPFPDPRCTDSGPGGRTCCGGFCVLTLENDENCGGCGIACASGATCTNGVCQGPNCSGLSCLVTGNPF